MKIVLEPRNYIYNQMVLLDTESGEFFEFSRVDRPDLAKLKRTPADGLFSYVDKRLICFYYSDPRHSVKLKVDNDLIEIDYDDKVLLEKKERNSKPFQDTKRRKDSIFFSV